MIIKAAQISQMFMVFLFAMALIFLDTVNAKEIPVKETNDVDTLRVFTYNIQRGLGMDGITDIKRQADVIKEKNPHIVALQEVDVGVKRSGNIDIMTVFSGYLGMEPIFHKNIAHEGGKYGNGTLTNLPIISSRNMHYASTEGEQRGLQQIELDFNGTRIVVMNTHLDHRFEEERLNSVEQIIETTRAYRGAAVILTGDMNDTPESEVHKRLKHFFTDVWEEKGDGPGYTIPPNGPNRRIDYFFYTNNLVKEGNPVIRPIKMEVLDTDASDHLPIYAEFEVIH
ncbi:MAG: endonuclease/exonuclease/phosphatase family protein [Balneolales bacterium]